MATSPLLLAALLTLYVMPTALAHECYECTNTPGFPAVSQCDSENVGSITCNPLFDKCTTITGTMEIPGGESLNIEMKNCSSSIFCNPDSPLEMCKLLNVTGLMSKCHNECCEGDNCNSAVRISGLVASLVAVLLALFLN